MENAASLKDVPTATWQVVRDGAPLANVVTRVDGAGVMVATQILGAPGDAERIRPHRFPDLESAEQFVQDLVSSFSYLGCQVART